MATSTCEPLSKTVAPPVKVELQSVSEEVGGSYIKIGVAFKVVLTLGVARTTVTSAVPLSEL